MSENASIRPERALRTAIVALLGVALAGAVAGTAHWPIVGDAPLMHYVAFLLDHGKAPYRDVIDINMPGTYALEWGAIHLLGPGAVAWRVFDVGLVAVCVGAMVWITARVDWLAGFFGGALFALIHLRDGPTHTGQRDLMMATMLLAAVGFLFETTGWQGTKGESVHSTHVDDETVVMDGAPRLRWLFAAGFGLFAGMATTIKPSGVFFALGLLLLLWVWLRGRVAHPTRTFVAAVVGFALPLVAMAVWLQRTGALRAFFDLDRGLMAYHASLGRPSWMALVVGSFPSVLLAVALPALLLFVAAKAWRGWKAQVVMLCAVLGAVSYILQGKGFPYHRYPTEAFLLLGCGVALVTGLRATGWMRWVAIAGVLLGGVWLGPDSAWIACHYDWRNQEFNHALEADLTRLGGVRLQDKVQCVDMTSGCLNTLYNMEIVQSTGYLYDCYLFQPKQTPVSEAYRAGFWQAMEETRPAVMVVTDQECFSMARSWELPQRWPQFAEWLQSDYVLERQYTPPHLVGWWRKPSAPYSYRLYVRKDR